MKPYRRLLVATLILMLGCFGLAVLAQETPPPATDMTGPIEESTTFMTLLRQGGVLMWPLGVLSVATIALSVYGFLAVRSDKMMTPDLVPILQKNLDDLDLHAAAATCDGAPGLLTNILAAGLRRVSDGVLDVASMEKAMEEASVEETQSGMRVIGYLSIIAQVAPMVGLLGTVSGMIKAFQKIGKGAMGRPEVLAADIGEALVTTATGLIIGIPAMFLYFYLKGRYTANVTKAGRVLGNLMHHLVAASRRAPLVDDITPAAPAWDASQTA